MFLDRDGVINKTFVRDGVTRPPSELADLQLLPGVTEACRRLDDAGFALIVVTNQPDVARGAQRRENVEAINACLRDVLPLRDVLTCYHDNGDGCGCRKPEPGMLLEAARRWDINLRHSFLVGDRWSDIRAGQTAGCPSALVETPFSGGERCAPEARVTGLAEAADWILTFKDERGTS